MQLSPTSRRNLQRFTGALMWTRQCVTVTQTYSLSLRLVLTFHLLSMKTRSPGRMGLKGGKGSRTEGQVGQRDR